MTVGEYEKVCDLLQSFSVSDQSDILEIRLNLSHKERRRIYEKISTYFEGLLYTQTKHQDFNDGTEYTILHVVKSSCANSQEILNSLGVKNDDQIAVHFDKFFHLGIPVARAKYLPYFLEILEKYNGAQKLYMDFKADVGKLGGISALNKYVGEIFAKMRAFMLENEDFLRFLADDFEEEKRAVENSIYKSCESVYSVRNENQLFISVDINKANFTVLRTFAPKIFGEIEKWEDFVAKFDTENIMTTKSSKFLREKFFGDLQTSKKVRILSEFLVRKVLSESEISPENVVMLSGDEFVVKYSPEIYTFLREKYHNATFKVLSFRLVKLPRYKYFVKEYFHEKISEISHIEFKCVPTQFLIESIKKYEGKSIENWDKLFTTEGGRIAMHIDSIYDD